MSAAGEGAPGAVVKVENGSNPSMTQRRNRLFKKPNNPVVHTPKETKFEGRGDPLNGYIFDCSYHQSDEYTKTIKEITEYVGRTYKYGNDAKLVIEYLRTQCSRSQQTLQKQQVDQSRRFGRRKLMNMYKENQYIMRIKNLHIQLYGVNAAMKCKQSWRVMTHMRTSHLQGMY
jgi:hypothetical protein